MKKLTYISLCGMLSVLMLVLACRPNVQPSPPAPQAALQPSPTAQQVAPPPSPTTSQPAPRPSSSVSDWDKVLAAAKTEGKVTEYTTDFLAGPTKPVADKLFTEKYGIQLDEVDGPSTQMAERIRTEHRAKMDIADVLFASQTVLLDLERDGLLQPIGDLPALAEKHDWFFPPRYDPEGYILSWGKTMVVAYINTNLVKPGEEPKSYFDLLKPQWKSKMVAPMPLPLIPITYATLKYNKVLDVDDYYRRLGQQELKVVPSFGVEANMLARGEVSLAIAGPETIFGVQIKEGAPIKPVYFNEGVPLRNMNAMSMTRGAPHPNATRVLLDWLFSAQAQIALSEVGDGSPGREDLPSFSPVDKILGPGAKIFFPQNEWIDKEAARVQREQVIERLIGVAR